MQCGCLVWGCRKVLTSGRSEAAEQAEELVSLKRLKKKPASSANERMRQAE